MRAKGFADNVEVRQRRRVRVHRLQTELVLGLTGDMGLDVPAVHPSDPQMHSATTGRCQRHNSEIRKTRADPRSDPPSLSPIPN